MYVHVYAGRKNYAQAERLLHTLVQDKELAKSPELWRMREACAKQVGQFALALTCLEMALDLEFKEMPELIDLQSVREDYRGLLNHYQKIADAHGVFEKKAPKDFLAKVI